VGFVRASAGRLGERVKLTQSRRDMRLRLLLIADIPLSLASFHRTRVQPRVTPTLPAALVSASSVRKGAPRGIGLDGEAPDASQGPQRAIGGRNSGCSGGREADHDRRRGFSECPGSSERRGGKTPLGPLSARLRWARAGSRRILKAVAREPVRPFGDPLNGQDEWIAERDRAIVSSSTASHIAFSKLGPSGIMPWLARRQRFRPSSAVRTSGLRVANSGSWQRSRPA
jgi:hypothetical protein